MSDEKRAGTEFALKNEIKFLIGKLLKAKSKIGEDNDVNELLTKIKPTRSNSVKKPIASTKVVSPLDLSGISRSSSPFCI